MSSTLIPAERKRLDQLEAVIKRGLETIKRGFIEAGDALSEVRDSRLYLDTHKSFEAYLRERWGMSRQRGYQLIDAAKVSTVVDIPNERVAREIVPLLREGEAEVIEVVRELKEEFGEEAFAALRLKPVVKNRLRRIRGEKERDERRAAACRKKNRKRLPTDVDLREGAFQDVLADVRDVDLIFTDPPYLKEYLPLWSDLSEWAANALKPDGLLITYSGQYQLPEVFARMGEHLEYVWEVALLMEGGSHNANLPRRIHSGWKPLLLYARPGASAKHREWVHDVVKSKGHPNVAGREFHEWEQDIEPARHLIEALTEPGDLVADPFLGAGTFALAAHELNRRVVGAEVDPVSYGTSVARLGSVVLPAKGEPKHSKGEPWFSRNSQHREGTFSPGGARPEAAAVTAKSSLT